jgi:hypothetical protein
MSVVEPQPENMASPETAPLRPASSVWDRGWFYPALLVVAAILTALFVVFYQSGALQGVFQEKPTMVLINESQVFQEAQRLTFNPAHPDPQQQVVVGKYVGRAIQKVISKYQQEGIPVVLGSTEIVVPAKDNVTPKIIAEITLHLTAEKPNATASQ